MSKRVKIRRRLRRVARQQTLVRIRRSVARKQTVEGYVVGIGKRWVLIRATDGAASNGWTALRLDQVRQIERSPVQRITRKLLRLHGEWPPSPPIRPVDLEHGVKKLIISLAGEFPLLAIHYERLGRAPLYVGRPHRWHKRKVGWHDLNPAGRWTGRAETARLPPITRVSVDDTYLRVLAEVCGPEPVEVR